MDRLTVQESNLFVRIALLLSSHDGDHLNRPRSSGLVYDVLAAYVWEEKNQRAIDP
jgi:hypothetical protein